MIAKIFCGQVKFFGTSSTKSCVLENTNIFFGVSLGKDQFIIRNAVPSILVYLGCGEKLALNSGRLYDQLENITVEFKMEL
jgi:hypothetical protein